MAINYNLINKGGISLSANFELLSEKPLDARHVVPTFEGLQNYIDNGAAYEGMIVYVSDQQVHYRVEAVDGSLSYRELNWTEEELKALIASETVESFNAAAEAIATEKADRIAATTVLDNKLTQETQRATAEELRIETSLSQRATALRTDLELLATDLETETTNRIAADSSLLTTINNEITRATQTENTLRQELETSLEEINKTIDDHCLTEAAARKAEIELLTETTSKAVTEVTNQLETEVEARSEADQNLEQQLTDEKISREEAIVRLQAALETEINAVKATEETLAASISQEATTRASMDTALMNLINSILADYATKAKVEGNMLILS